jgi:type IV pilus assembly protein PilC
VVGDPDGGVAGLFILVSSSPGSKAASTLRDAFLLKVPVLGETIQYALVERFCRVLASMVSAPAST